MAKKKNQLFKNFRRQGNFITFWHSVYDSPAFQSLSLRARCLLFEFQYRFTPTRNGRIVMSVETAMERLNVKSYRTMQKAFEELQAKGFIVMNLDSDHTKGRAREWRLTYEPSNGREPTDEWKL
ncbi:MAG: hypothetical protein EOM12_09855 [Verrucomicrobiae bacterium]|nr:hypothetical protein [Verrucomicrobiae bacterium]